MCKTSHKAKLHFCRSTELFFLFSSRFRSQSRTSYLEPEREFVHPCGPRLRWRSPPPDATWPLRMNCDVKDLTVSPSGQLRNTIRLRDGHGQRPNHQFCRAPYLHRNPAPLPPWLKQTSSPAAIIETPTTWRFNDVRSTISFLPSGKHWDSEDWLEYSRTIETKDSPKHKSHKILQLEKLPTSPSYQSPTPGKKAVDPPVSWGAWLDPEGDGSNNGSKTVPPGDGFAAAETNAPGHCHSQGLSQFSHEGVRRCAVQDLTKLVLWMATVTSCHIMSQQTCAQNANAKKETGRNQDVGLETYQV